MVRFLYEYVVYDNLSIWDIYLNYSQRIFAHLLPERPYIAMRNRYRSNFWSRGKLFCLEMLRSIIRLNFQRHGAMFPPTNAEIAWKTLNAIMLKFLFVDEQADVTLD